MHRPHEPLIIVLKRVIGNQLQTLFEGVLAENLSQECTVEVVLPERIDRRCLRVCRDDAVEVLDVCIQFIDYFDLLVGEAKFVVLA
jgi:hypothetical protein